MFDRLRFVAGVLLVLTPALSRAEPPAVTDLVRDLAGGDDKVRDKAISAIIALGPRANEQLPEIVKALQSSNRGDASEKIIRIVASVDRSKVKPFLRSYLSQVFRSSKVSYSPEFAKEIAPLLLAEVTDLLKDPAPEVRYNSRELLVGLGEKAQPAIPQLVECLALGDQSERWAVVQAILQIDISQYRQAFPRLLALLQSGYAEGERAGMLLRPVAAEVTGELIAQLEQSDGPAPMQIRRALANMGKPVILPLCNTLAHGRPGLRAGAALTLGDMSAERDAVMPELLPAIHDPDGSVRLAVAEAIVNLDYTRSAPVVSALREFLRGKDSTQAQKAARLLEIIGSRAHPASDDLLKLLQHDELPVAWQAAEALWAIDNRFGAAMIPAICRVLADGTVPQQRRAVSIAGSMGPLALPCTAHLVRLCHEADVPMRLACADALPRITPAVNEEVARSLAFVLQQKHRLFRRYRHQCFIRLEKLGPDARFCLPTLADIVADEESSYRTTAARVMVRIAPEEKSIGKDYLRSVIWNRNSYDWDDVADALNSLGPKAAFAMPELLAVLRDRPTSPDPVIIEILTEIGPGASAALPYLLEALALPKYGHKDRCIRAIQSIDPDLAKHLKLK